MTTDIENYQWRGLGGAPATLRSVEFDRHLDKISLWLESWSHAQRCSLLEALITRTSLRQIQFLKTATQPSLHRDFMYAARKEFPSLQFDPVSTHCSRDVKKRLRKNKQDNFHRIQSAFFQNLDEIRRATNEKCLLDINKSAIVLEPMKQKNSPITSGLPPVRSRNQAVLFDGEGGKSRWPLLDSAPPYLRFIEMPVRRHIQEEESPQIKYEASLSGLSSSINSPLLKSHSALEFSLRHRKYHSLPVCDKCNGDHEKAQLNIEIRQVLQWYFEMWNDVQRNEFLHKILLKLDPRQHYFISTFLSMKESKDFITLLPKRLSLKILGYMTPRELGDISLVNRKWYKMCNNNELWKVKCDEVQLDIPVKAKKPQWKKIFKENNNIKSNWNTGNCQVIDCTGHTDRVLCVTCDPRRLATGSADKTIKLWDSKSGHLLQTLQGHSKGVWCLRFFTKHLLVSGSYDCTIRVWNLREGTCARTLVGHEGPVWAIVNRGTTFVSASQDKTAKVWDMSRCMLEHTLSGHSEAVFCVEMDEEGTLVITGSADRSVRIWKRDSGDMAKILWVSQSTSVMAVSYSKGYIACSYGGTICLYKVEGAKLVKKYEEHEKRVETLQLKVKDVLPQKLNGILVSAGQDGVLKYWDLHKGKSVHTFTGHTRQVNCVYFDETRIISTSYDNHLKIWDFCS